MVLLVVPCGIPQNFTYCSLWFLVYRYMFWLFLVQILMLTYGWGTVYVPAFSKYKRLHLRSACAVKNRDEIRHIFWWYSGATFPFYQFLQKQCYNKHNMYVFHHYYPKNPRSVNVVAFLAQGEFEVNIHRKTRFGSKWLLWERERNKNLCQRNALSQSTTWTGEISRNMTHKQTLLPF